MPTPNLAPVYLDDTRVQLSGDPRPKVSKILERSGQEAGGDLRVMRLSGDAQENPVGMDEVIERTNGEEPIRLRCVRGHGAPSLQQDESTGLGTAGTSGTQQFGAARPGQAGQGAQGDQQRGRSAATRTAVRPDAQAKSDFTGPPAEDSQPSPPSASSAQGTGLEGTRSGGANQTYGVGDLAPGGRSGLDGSRGVGLGDEQPVARGTATGHGGHLDGTQEFQSGGRQGEGGAPPYADEGVGSTGRRQAGNQPASGIQARSAGAQGGMPFEPTGGLRDQSTDHSGRQQGATSGVSTKDARPQDTSNLADATSSGAEMEGERPAARKPAVGSADEPAEGASGKT